MKIYQGGGGGQKLIRRCQRDGVGIFLCDGWRNPIHWPYFAIDNGAYSAWSNQRDWDELKFRKLLARVEESGLMPDFVVCPDKVAAGLSSLSFSITILGTLPEEFNYYLAVQDGMTPVDVTPHLGLFGGIFVGGTMDWKLATAEDWIALAHRNGKPCHIGRIGPWHRIMWALRIRADSIDSTTWIQQDRWHHIETVKVQAALKID